MTDAMTITTMRMRCAMQDVQCAMQDEQCAMRFCERRIDRSIDAHRIASIVLMRITSHQSY